MFFSRKKQGFKSKNNVLRKLYNRYSGLIPLAVVFSLGVFGTSIFYKNQPAVTMSQQGSYSADVEMVTSQLNNEKDITDSLSGKNLELKQQLKEALNKVGSNDEEVKLTSLTSELRKEKQDNQKLNDENARLKVRINSMLATIGNVETVKNENFNKVKMDSTDTNLTDDKEKSLTKNRNSTPKMIKRDEEESKSVVNSNKVRTMKLKKGESLWNLSKRAYGKGVYYKKIIKANPSITEKSFKKLRPGAEINVPE